MTTACWEEDSVKRPKVDDVLDSLRSAAEQWEPKHGVLSRDGWRPALSEKSDSPTVPDH